MSEASLQQALEEIEKTQRNTERLRLAAKLTEPMAQRKQAALARAHKTLTFFIANQDWILDIYRQRERMRQDAEALCAADPLLGESLRDAGTDASAITSIRPATDTLPHTETPTP